MFLHHFHSNDKTNFVTSCVLSYFKGIGDFR